MGMSLNSNIPNMIPAWLLVMVMQLSGCYHEEMVPESLPVSGMKRMISLDGIHGFVDGKEHLVCFAISRDTLESFCPQAEIKGYDNISISGVVVEPGQTFDFGMVVAGEPRILVAERNGKADTFQLVFTTLPLIHLVTAGPVRQEPKVPAYLELQYATSPGGKGSMTSFSSSAGVEIRGSTSANHPKKPYGFELRNNPLGPPADASLLGMRNHTLWVLDAMYIDPLKMRNRVSVELWNAVVANGQHGGYASGSPVEWAHVELFVNNRYQGLYCLGQKLDGSLLGFTEGADAEGRVLYKAVKWEGGATRFQVMEDPVPPRSAFWDGWEQVYPEGYGAWGPLASLRECVVHADSAAFAENIGRYINLETVRDYYLFINVALGYDNVGKNLFYARFNPRSPLVMLPWDLEATWGKMYDISNSLTSGIASNRLFDRLIEYNVSGFRDSLQSAWLNHRQTVLHEDSISAVFGAYYSMLKTSGALERDGTRWAVKPDALAEYQYLLDWIHGRLNYMDGLFR